MAEDGLGLTIVERLSAGSIVYQDGKLMSDLVANLKRSRQEGRFTDVNIVVGDRTFPCHKFVIEANCPYFKAYFSFTERCKETNVIQLEGVSSSAFEALLDFLYSSEITITLENAQEVLRCADFLQCSSVVQICSDFLIQHIRINNCLDLYKLAHACSVISLKAETWKFVLCHFEQIVKTPSFLSLPVDILLCVVGNDTLCARSETSVLAAILQWLEHDGRRLEVADSVLDSVRWNLVEQSFLDGLPSVVNVDVQELVSAAKQRQTSDCLARLSEFVGVVDIELSTGISFHDKESGEFAEESRFPFSSRTRFHCANMDNILYISGGYVRKQAREKEVTGDLWRFDIGESKWEKKTSMQFARYNHCSAALGKQLYVFGGVGRDSALGSFDGEVYDSKTDQWSRLSRPDGLGHELKSVSAVVPVLGKLYVLAYRGNSPLVHAFAYDQQHSAWIHVPELEKHPIDIKSCCTIKGFLAFFEPEHEGTPRHRRPLDEDEDFGFDDGEDSVPRISRLRVFNPLNGEFPLQDSSSAKGFLNLRAERKLPGGVTQHKDKLVIFRYTQDMDDPMFMYEAEVVALDFCWRSSQFRHFADYDALPFDGSELCVFSGFKTA